NECRVMREILQEARLGNSSACACFQPCRRSENKRRRKPGCGFRVEDRIVLQPHTLGQEQPLGNTVLMARKDPMIVSQRLSDGRNPALLLEVVAEREPIAARVVPVALILRSPAFRDCFGWL